MVSRPCVKEELTCCLQKSRKLDKAHYPVSTFTCPIVESTVVVVLVVVVVVVL